MKKLIYLFALIPFFAFAQIGCIDPNATNYNSTAIIDDGSCYFNVYEENPNQNVLYIDSYHGYFRIDKYITDNGGFRVHIKAAMGENQQNDASYAVKSIGDILHHNPSVGDFQVLNFDDSSPNGGVANVGFANGMHVDLHGDYSTNKMHQPSYANNSGDWSYWYNVGSAGYTNEFVEFDWQPSDYNLFLNSTVGFVLNNRSFRIYNSTFNGDSHIDKSFNMEPIQSDYGSITTPLIPTGSITITDNGITISNSAVFGSSSGYARVTKAVKRLSNGTYAFDDIDGNQQNDLYKISPSNNTYTFEVGPLQDGVFGDYEIWIGDINYSSSSLRKYVIDNAQTLPYISPSNIVAVNDGNNKVNISWTKESSIPTSELIYYVDRGELSADGEDTIWNEGGADSLKARYVYNGATGVITNRTNGDVAYTGDDEFSYTDLEADPTATYIYRIRTAGATDNVYYNGLDGENAVVMGTGAGIDFPTIYLPSDAATMQCGAADLKWNEVELNSTDYPEFTVNSTDYSWTNEFYLVTSPVNFTDTVYQGTQPFSTVSINDDQFGEQSFLVYTSATRSDGKVFTSFYPTLIKTQRIPIPKEVTTFSGGSNTSAYTLEWDAFTAEDYVDNIVISYSSSNGTEVHSLDWSDSSHDADITPCEEVVFSIKTENCQTSTAPEESGITTTSGVYMLDIHNTFVYHGSPITNEPFKDLDVSAGEFGDRVELFWGNNNNSAVNSFEVMRRLVVDDQSTSFQKIGERSRDVHAYTDLYADANQLYEYQIQAKFGCTSDSTSNTDVNSSQPSNKAVGFRAPTSDLFGRVTYDNGSPAEDIIVTANTSDPFLNKSLFFEDTAHIELYDIFHNQNDNSFSLMSWIKPDPNDGTGLHTIFSRIDTSTANDDYGLYIVVDPSDDQLKIYENTSSDLTLLNPNDPIDLYNSWQQLTITYNDMVGSLNVFINGEPKFEGTITDAFTDEDEFTFGLEQVLTHDSITLSTYTGYMDEISIWSSVLADTTIANNFSKYFSNQETDLLAYYHCDEGAGDSIYDISKSAIGIFHKNNSKINSVSFSTITPSQDQIGYKGLSDDMGYYSVKGVRFNHTGTNFSITPAKAIVTATDSSGNTIITEPAHEFTPNVASAFFGDGIDYLSNYDFTDVSSFDVTGNVYFLDPNKTTSEQCIATDGGSYSQTNSAMILESCTTKVSLSNDDFVQNIGVEGAALYIDNLPAYDEEGSQIFTDSDGAFSITVPIGRHQISVQKDGHTFINNAWNSPNHTAIIVNENTADAETRKVYNFNQNLSNITFYDNTVRVLVGRICGGTVEANKTYGNEESINNIGAATFTLKNVGTEVHSLEISTNTQTGEYSTNLLPIQYQLKSDNTGTLFEIINNSTATDYFKSDIGNGQPYPFPTIDMSEKGNLYNYKQEFYDDIISIEAINTIGKEMELLTNATDSTQVIADSILVQYYDLINNPNTINIDDSGEDDSDNYPYLFETMSHADISSAYSAFEYDRAENFVYRVNPTITYYSSTYDHDNDATTDELEILGEPNWITLVNELPVEVPNAYLNGAEIDYHFGYPIFTKDQSYTLSTTISEVYHNYDDVTTITDEVLVETGQFNLSDGVLSNTYDVKSAETNIPFTPRFVNTSLDDDNSFQQNFTLNYSEGVVAIDETLDYYVFGSRPDEGTTYFSSGPDVVEMVLRDPPGDQSYAYMESGSTTSEEISVHSVGFSIGEHLKKEINLGSEVTMSFFAGPELTVEAILNTDLNLVSQYLEGETTKNVVTTNYNESYQTSSNPYNIGAGGDVYIARNYNILYGTNHYLEVIDVNLCGNQGVVCMGEDPNTAADLDPLFDISLLNDYSFTQGANEFILGTSVGLDIVPVGFESKTVYDQNHIVHNLIPTLKWIRNTYFGMTGVYDYTSTTPCYDNESHPNYSDVNLTPCYTYNEANDISDPLVLPFDAYEDINLSEFIPVEFEDLVMNYMIHTQNGSGTFYNFSNESIDVLSQLASAMESGNSVMNVINDIASQSFWQDVATILGGHNLLSGLNDFTNALNSENSNINALAQGLGNLQSYIDDIYHTPPGDKVKFYNEQIKLWETAIALNETDKLSIIADAQGVNTNALAQGVFAGTSASLVLSNPISHIGDAVEGSSSFGPDDNISFSAGNSIAASSTYSQSKTKIVSVNYSINGEIAFEIGAKVNGFGGSYNDIIPISFALNETETNVTASNVSFGYVLGDDDEADFISVDIKDSDIGFGPIFRKRGGQTMCPHETEDMFLFIDTLTYPIVEQLNGVFSVATQPREVPGIAIDPSLLTNVPEMQQAVFNLSLTNNSAAMQDMVYTLMVDEASNPYGAIIKMDGLPVFRQIMVPYGQTIHKTITVEKGPEHLDFIDNTGVPGADDRLSLILRSSCQYNYGTSNTPDIADTISFGVSFLPGCTPISITQPVENWIINKSTEQVEDGVTTNVITFDLDEYDYNYYSLDKVYLQYKKSNEPESAYATQTIGQFQKIDDAANPETGFDSLEANTVSIVLNTQDWEDGDYDLRAYTDCSLSSVESVVISGHKDTRLPEPFGNPSPADGILSPNDEVMLKWTEDIDQSSYYSPQAEITVLGIKNNAEVRHDAYLYLDASDALSIPTGVNLQNKSFTVEMWVKPESSGVLFAQGYNDGDQISLGIDVNHTLYASYAVGTSIVKVNSTTSVSIGDWNHLAFVFDNQTKEISFITNGMLADVNDVQDFNCVYTSEGVITLGTDYQGALHNMRIWSCNRLSTSISANMLQHLTGTEAGLIGCWPMNELSGLPIDKSRARNIVGDVNWAVAEKGKGYNFNASESHKLTAEFGTVSFDQTHDFTIEFWFKTNGPSEMIFSTGIYNITDSFGNLDAWSIGLNSNGKLKVLHNENDESTTLMISADAFNDNAWHHFTLVKNAKANTVMYIDGVEEASVSSVLTRGFASPQLTLGAKAYQNSATTTYSQYYTGTLDEVRVWSLARTYSQVERYRHLRLHGNELGLEAYYPFEGYEISAGVSSITGDALDHADTLNLVGFNDSHVESSDLPLMKMINPIEIIASEKLVNSDETLILLTEELQTIEGCILDVYIDKVMDLYGNTANPVTWSFYVDKNQLIWNEAMIVKEKLLGEPLVFQTYIENQSGAIEHFEISNLPEWLSVSPSEGLLEPNSVTEIEFVVHEDLFIGDYQIDIVLSGNNEYAEILDLQVEVSAPAPIYDLNPSDFAFSMSFIGKVTVDDVRSRDEDDVLFAYVGEELRGASQLMYVEAYDAYLVLMSVYSNSTSNEEVEFILWDASEGKLHAHLEVNGDTLISFNEGAIVGSFSELVNFHAYNKLIQEIPMTAGWNWVSFNLDAEEDLLVDKLDIETVTSELAGSDVLIFKYQTEYAQYNSNDNNWYGGLLKLPVNHMYKLQLTQADTIAYEGIILEPESVPIELVQGWNWISYLGQRVLEINQALSSLNPTVGDIIKSRTGFSMYASESLGWLGTLTNMNSGIGYMMYQSSEDISTLIYPNSSMYLASRLSVDKNQYTDDYWNVNTGKFEHSMNIVARIDHPDYNKPHSDNVLAAFADDECLGNISATVLNAEESLYFITIYGEQNSVLDFKYYDAESEQVFTLENNIEFEGNQVIGTINNPFMFTVNTSLNKPESDFDFAVYPNPFNDVFELEFMLEESVNVDIKIVDVMGRIVEEISSDVFTHGKYSLGVDGEKYEKGIYFVEVSIDGILFKKLIIKS